MRFINIEGEAEDFIRQEKHEVRSWHLVKAGNIPTVMPDGDPPHWESASGKAYLELLPDTRRTHDDKLIRGENFSDEPGKVAILTYKIQVPEAGRWHVWVRAHPTGTEDNGLHVGIDGTWPEHGKRMQFGGAKGWVWSDKQRTEKVHSGVAGEIYLDIEKPGEHMLHFSMREDGFEFDKFILTRDPKFRPDSALAEEKPRKPDGTGAVTVTGELKQWHKVTLNLEGPFARETDSAPNPFTDNEFTVTFRHTSGKSYKTPGYFAADGNAAESSATEGKVWRAHLAPDLPGTWSYTTEFRQSGKPLPAFHGKSGSFTVGKTDKRGADFRGKGRLEYAQERYLRFAGTGERFLKVGADAPETLLAYADFDDTVAPKKNAPLKTWQPHLRDAKSGDPTWKDGKGKGLLGALNYLAGKGVNGFSFLTYNASGDGDNIWPFVSRNDKFHYDCSKLDQWGRVFDHAQSLGLFLHFKLQENELDDNRRGEKGEGNIIPESLDGGKLGPERKLYLKELIARFGYLLALNWNLGEENTQSTEEQKDMAGYIAQTDPYPHHIVIHTFPPQQDKVYGPLLGKGTAFTGASLQNSWSAAHARTLKWILESEKAGKPWVVCNDEQNPADMGAPPDPGYAGGDGVAIQGGKPYTLHDIRKQCLWGTLMAGGAGVEYYFGYKLAQNDLICEDWRSRDKSWEYGAIALRFFAESKLPFWETKNADTLTDAGNFCLAKVGSLYLIYAPSGGSPTLELTGIKKNFRVSWFNPQTGGALRPGSVRSVSGGGKVALGMPPGDPQQDWLVVVQA